MMVNKNNNNNNTHTHSDLIMKTFMDKVGLDVFQFILSFLPPVPYLFQLQRVSKHYSQLCQLCMEEDCTELYFDEEAISEMNEHMKQRCSVTNKVDSHCIRTMLKRLKPSETSWVLFFRDILHRFKKLDRLVLKNMTFSNLILYIIMVDWKGSLKELKLVECEISARIPYSFYVSYDGSDEISTVRENPAQPVGRFVGGQLEDFSLDGCVSREYMSHLRDSMKSNCIESIKITSSSPLHTLPYHGYYLIALLKMFPKLSSCYCSLFRSNTPTWQSAMLLFPDVDFQLLPRELASKDYEFNPKQFYIDYLCKEYKLTRSRLERMEINQNSNENVHILFGSVINFLDVYAPFGLDTKVRDIRGSNVIQLAILFTNFEVVRFIVRYLTALEDQEQATKELTQLFSDNNRLDGKNALFKCLTPVWSNNYFSLLLEYKVSFSLPASDGSTILHNLCQFGQLARLQSLWQVLESVPAKEKQYYLDFTRMNNNGETPLMMCKKNYMTNMARLLESLAESCGVDLKTSETSQPPPPPQQSSLSTTRTTTATDTSRQQPTTGKSCEIM